MHIIYVKIELYRSTPRGPRTVLGELWFIFISLHP